MEAEYKWFECKLDSVVYFVQHIQRSDANGKGTYINMVVIKSDKLFCITYLNRLLDIEIDV